MNEKQNEKQAIHFGIKIRNKKYSLRLCREEFALINTKPSFKPVQWLYDIGAYTDYTCSEYSREWCEEYREICLKNYDINMEFFIFDIKEQIINTETNIRRKNKGKCN